ncbi:MAG: hypothetical protein VW397_02705 [Candidatus Margulisiibacteriota bacterium]
MYIFYDFETSDKDFLGQILAYYFVLVDNQFNPIQELSGLIKPNRLECPRAMAIKVNQLSINKCITQGESEFDAANTIYNFMQTHTNDYGALPLVGFNSARFDFKHFEKLLLKHGLNPTFYGKISSLDIYQYAKYCALHNTDTFPFTQKKQQDTNSFSFKLEDLAKAFDCLHTPQTHDAKEDVLLTIELTKQLERNFPTSLKDFHALQHNTTPFLDPNVILKEPYFPFEQTATTPLVDYNEWLVIGKASKTTFILLDINAYQTQPKETFLDYAKFTRYFNTRANALIASQHTNPTPAILDDPNVTKIADNALQYFKLFPVDWDIEYRPWAMGFESITILRNFIEKLTQNPNEYDDIINEWRDLKNITPNRKNELNFMITLFNRYYLNHHPNPKKEHLEKYLNKRYKTGEMYRNPIDFSSPETEKNTIDFFLPHTTSETEKKILIELKDFTKSFIQTHLKD